MKEIILTNTGKLGDFLYCLPIASWLARTRDCKIHWVLPNTFEPFNYITSLLMLQPFTSRVTLVPFKVLNYNCGGQPYRFDPRLFAETHTFFPELLAGEILKGNAVTREQEYYNLGFRGYPDKYVSAFYAEEHGFYYDRDFRLEIFNHGIIGDGKPAPDGLFPLLNKEGTIWTEVIPATGEIVRSTEWGMTKLVPHATPMPQHEDLLTLARRMAAAKEVHTWFCGLAILCHMARIPVIVHRVPGHARIPLYYEGDCRHVTFVEHSEEEAQP